MQRDPSSNDRSLPPEIVAAIDAALSDLEKTLPGVSRDPDVRSEVEAAVAAAVASLDRVVPEVTEAETGRAMEAFQSAKEPSDAASRRRSEEHTSELQSRYVI